jgi:hypothetical protein
MITEYFTKKKPKINSVSAGVEAAAEAETKVELSPIDPLPEQVGRKGRQRSVGARSRPKTVKKAASLSAEHQKQFPWAKLLEINWLEFVTTAVVTTDGHDDVLCQVCFSTDAEEVLQGVSLENGDDLSNFDVVKLADCDARGVKGMCFLTGQNIAAWLFGLASSAK